MFQISLRTFHQCGVQCAQFFRIGDAAFRAVTPFVRAYFANRTTPPVGLRFRSSRASPELSGLST
jgi:hypothetical protein